MPIGSEDSERRARGSYLSLSPDKALNEAICRVEACRGDLSALLAEARREYTAVISELEALAASSTDRRDDPFSSRSEVHRRSRLLHETAAGFDNSIARLSGALECLNSAVMALEGNGARPSPAQDSAETSIEAVVIQAQEEERYRLAREIHDGPAQILANVALQLEYISKLAVRDPSRARDEMAIMQRDLRLAVAEVRRFMYDLKPPALAQQGVGPAVESHCQRLSGRFGLEIDVRWDSDAALPSSHDTAVFRIVQEALQNVVKHAQATRVEVRATQVDGVLEVSVADNGKGFDPQRVHRLDASHFGLAGMRARAHQIGATLEISSLPGRGTVVLLRVPLQSPVSH